MRKLLSFRNSLLSRFLHSSRDLLAVKRTPAWLQSLSHAADTGRLVLSLSDNIFSWGKECKRSIPPVDGHVKLSNLWVSCLYHGCKEVILIRESLVSRRIIFSVVGNEDLLPAFKTLSSFVQPVLNFSRRMEAAMHCGSFMTSHHPKHFWMPCYMDLKEWLDWLDSCCFPFPSQQYI